jgi:diamine N-acetyltransferase
MLLENDLITLRAVEPQDLDLLYAWENNTQLWDAGNTRNPYSKFALKQYIIQSDQDIYETKQLRLMIMSKESKKAVGTVDLFDFDLHNNRIALGLFVDFKFQGKGYAKESLHLIEDYVFNYLRINQMYAQIAESNTASRQMFELENYQSNGILKNWIKTTKGYENIIVFQQFKSIHNNRNSE